MGTGWKARKAILEAVRRCHGRLDGSRLLHFTQRCNYCALHDSTKRRNQPPPPLRLRTTRGPGLFSARSTTRSTLSRSRRCVARPGGTLTPTLTAAGTCASAFRAPRLLYEYANLEVLLGWRLSPSSKGLQHSVDLRHCVCRVSLLAFDINVQLSFSHHRSVAIVHEVVIVVRSVVRQVGRLLML